jgi:hypothetical protein
MYFNVNLKGLAISRGWPSQGGGHLKGLAIYFNVNLKLDCPYSQPRRRKYRGQVKFGSSHLSVAPTGFAARAAK